MRPDYYPGFFDNTGDRKETGSGRAGCVRRRFRDHRPHQADWRLRFNHDEKECATRACCGNARDANLLSTPGRQYVDKLFAPVHIRQGGAPTAGELQLINYYGQGVELTAALLTPARSRAPGDFGCRATQSYNETRDLASARTFDWDETTRFPASTGSSHMTAHHHPQPRLQAKRCEPGDSAAISQSASNSNRKIDAVELGVRTR
jgi:hypothetical protein